MKYHYQFVSPTTVRIELIPEDQKETTLLNSLKTAGQEDQQLKAIFNAGLCSYDSNTNIKKLNFMDFPKVALCTYEKIAVTENSPIL